MIHTFSFEPPPKTPLLSMNDRTFWRRKAEYVDRWRKAAERGARYARAQGELQHNLPACTVSITLPVRDSRRRDPHNYFATVKPIVDGLVDAELWPDDTPEYVTVTEPALHVKGKLVVVTMAERAP